MRPQSLLCQSLLCLALHALPLLSGACTPYEAPDRPPRPKRGDSGADSGHADTGQGDTGQADSGETDTGGDSADTADSETGGPDTADSGTSEGTGGSGGPTGAGSAAVDGWTYAYFVPTCALDAPAAVLYSQHGSGGNGSQMVGVWRSLAETECFIVIGQDSATGSSWNFNTDVQGLDAIITEVWALYDVDPARQFLHGYSAGAHWSYVIGLANSDFFGGFAVFAGTMAYAEQMGVWPDSSLRKIPVHISHGTADTVVSYAYATDAESKLEDAGWDVELYTITGGTHAYATEHQALAWAFLSAGAR